MAGMRSTICYALPREAMMPRPRNTAPWMTPSNLDYLRENWPTETAAKIAFVVGTTKNAIVGKAHLMKLPAKPQPGGRRARHDLQPVQPESRPGWSYPDVETAALVQEILAEREDTCPPVEDNPAGNGKGRLGSSNAPWMTPENLAYIRTCWGSVSAANIARVVGVSKYSIVTKAHRMGLPKLANPAKRAPDAPPIVRPPMQAPLTEPRDAPKPVIATPSRLTLVPPSPRQGPACCWPLGEPRRPGFRFCDDPTQPGRPYCAEHVRVGYVARKHDVGGMAIREAG
jgi:GcrA cell cycle regulator